MLSFKLVGGVMSVANPEDTSKVIYTNVEVHKDTVYISRFVASKLYSIEVAHENSVELMDAICSNYAKIDNDTFITICTVVA